MKLEIIIPDPITPFEFKDDRFSLKLSKELPEIVPVGDIIPANRRVDWAAFTGIPGGIPNRTTIFRTLSAGSGSSRSDVQAALNACPANQVVKLSAGNYTFDGHLDFFAVREGVVLRGEGPDTKITFSQGAILMRSISNENTLSIDANLTVGALKGATTIELASVPVWVKPDHVYIVDQLNDPAIAKSDGDEQAQIYRRQMGNGDRGIGQTVKVVSKTGNTVTLETPLYLDYPLVGQPQIAQSGYNAELYTPRRGCGIEDLTLDFVYTNGGANAIQMENCDGCWIKNVTATNCPGRCHVWACWSYRCEVFNSSFMGSHLFGSGQGYGVALYHCSCGWRVQNNTFRDLHCDIQLNYGSSGNVLSYNKCFAGRADSGQAPGISTHGCHAHMNLIEGNWLENKVLGDFTHGSSSHQTLFRNRIIGHEPGKEKNQVCVFLQSYNRKWNIIGNMLGDPGFHTVYESPPGSDARAIYKLEGDSAEVMDLLRYGNYDVVNGIDSYTPTKPLPASLYLAEKPAWLDGAWPLFDPLKP